MTTRSFMSGCWSSVERRTSSHVEESTTAAEKTGDKVTHLQKKMQKQKVQAKTLKKKHFAD